MSSGEAADGLRADARRNRGQLLVAATAVFVERGYDAPLDEVARRAGVGIGTLYRRFPQRESLVIAVVDRALRAVVDRLHADAATTERAWDVLIATSRYSQDLRSTLRAATPMPAALRTAVAADPGIATLRAAFTAELTALVERAQREGDLRDDVGPGDVISLFSLVLRSHDHDDPTAHAGATERAFAIVVDGLSALPRRPLPGVPVALSAFYHH